MKKNYLKKLIVFTLSAVMAASVLAGCGTTNKTNTNTPATFTDKDPKSYSGTLNVWSFTDELKTSHFIDEFNKVYPNIKINLTVIPLDNNAYSTKLASVLASGAGAPDVYTSEVSIVNRFVNLPYYENLSKAPYNAEDLAKGMAQYAVDLGRNQQDQGIRALTWQATPGGIFYKRSLAKQYFGTDDPDQISQMMSTFDGLFQMGQTLKDKSNDKVKLLAGYQELYNIALGSRQHAWVENNKLVIDQKMLDYVDQAKTVRDKGYDAKINQWTPAWSAAQGNNSVFGFVLPTWGLNYVIETNAPKTNGDWALAKAPTPYYWGGTWIGMYNKSKNKELAWQFIKYITTNKDFLTTHAKQTGDFLSSTDVDKQFANSSDGNVAFTGGQNLYKIYSDMLPGITGKLVTKYDETANNKFQADLDLYITGQKTKDQFIQQFKDDMKSAFPDLEVN